ncbi:RNA polymerase ECF family sigma subunit [Microbacterium sp. SLBN-154]|uniref:RNA polymerase sigma factor n=1 Tax=Microbacterium sp. SLBN-154 TaxID=2768458 RepID=UPI001174EDE2|nr:RNA polymerase sigma factor [Microbacterium sp. SLBN-154]TQK18510.1 RNA polymerase ECF family sigma subunit [Microbacterium sp. SLBN-154]
MSQALVEVSDAMLVARSLDQDTVAFGELVRRHSGLMRAYVIRMVGSRSEADDVVQEAFVTAWRQLPSLRDPSAVRAWLMRIASREASAFLRRRPKDADIADFDAPHAADTQPENVAMRHAQLSALSAALDTLPSDQRRCWLLREVAELSYDEIADEMQMPVSTVRGTLARARARITAQMEGWR